MCEGVCDAKTQSTHGFDASFKSQVLRIVKERGLPISYVCHSNAAIEDMMARIRSRVMWHK